MVCCFDMGFLLHTCLLVTSEEQLCKTCNNGVIFYLGCFKTCFHLIHIICMWVGGCVCMIYPGFYILLECLEGLFASNTFVVHVSDVISYLGAFTFCLHLLCIWYM